jgi:REP element-mobilizing transposase RayT
MANIYTSLHFHIVFSTKNREPWINTEIEQRIWEYLGGIARTNQMKALQIGGIEDHVHLIVGMRPTMSVSEAVQLLKRGSSKWIHETFPSLAGFAWQDDYGAFTVSKSQLPDVIQYAANQRAHHRVRTFQEE